MTAAVLTVTASDRPWWPWLVFGIGLLIMSAVLVTALMQDTPDWLPRPEIPAVMIERERDYDVIGYPNADLPAAPMEMGDE